MPLPVRVDPHGDPRAVRAIGQVFGNRGVLHREREIVRGWDVKRWICCVLEFRGRRHEVMGDGVYTGLFFRDEATALAAGHRPCMECRRGDANAFFEAWASVHGGPRPKAGELDEVLHAERVIEGAVRRSALGGQRRTHALDGSPLPDGAAVVDGDGRVLMARGGAVLPWSDDGLGAPVPEPGELRLLTPLSVVAVLRAGYVPADVPLLTG